MKALVTGATGFVGSHLVRALLRRGDTVRILARAQDRAAPLKEAGAEVRLGDLGEPSSLAGLADGIDVVFHLGSAMHGSSAVFDRVDVQGTQRLLEEAERAQVRRFVYVGTLSGYALAQERDGAFLDEQSPFDTTGLLGNYALAKGHAESAVQRANQRGKMEGVIVRLGLVCGDGASIFPAHVCQLVTPNLALMFGDGGIPLPLTYVDNAVDALVLGGTTPGMAGESFNIVDDEVLTQREYLALQRESTGGGPRIIQLPTSAYYALGVLTELAAAARKKEPTTTRYRIRTRLKRVRWNCSKAQRMLQWRPRVRLREGLAHTFRAHAARAGKLASP